MPAGAEPQPTRPTWPPRSASHLDAELLRRALTHRSYAYEHGGLPHNERLEFLGDAVLGHRRHRDPLPRAPRPARGQAGQAARLGREHARAGRRRPRHRAGRAGRLHAARPRRGGHRRPGQGQHPRRHAGGGARRGLPRARRSTAAARVVHELFDQLMRDVADQLAPASTGRPALQELTAERGLGVPEYVMSADGPGPRQDLHRPCDVSTASSSTRAPGAARRRPSRRAAETAWRALGRRGHAAPEGGREHVRAGAARGRDRPRRPAALGRRSAGGRPGRGEPSPLPSAGTPAGGADLAARLVGAPRRRGVTPRQVPVAARSTAPRRVRCVAHLGMSGQLLVAPADAPGERHLHVRISFADGGRAALRRPADLRRPVSWTGSSTRPTGRGDRCPASGRPHRPRPARPVASTTRCSRRGCAAATPAQARAARPEPDLRRSATSTPTSRCGGPGCTASGALRTLPRRRGRRAARPGARGAGGRTARRAAPPSTRCTSTSTARAATSTARWPSTAGRASPARGAAGRSAGCLHEPVQLLLPALPAGAPDSRPGPRSRLTHRGRGATMGEPESPSAAHPTSRSTRCAAEAGAEDELESCLPNAENRRGRPGDGEGRRTMARALLGYVGNSNEQDSRLRGGAPAKAGSRAGVRAGEGSR